VAKTRSSEPANRQAVIVDAVRTPIGRYAGALRDVRADDLAALVIRAVVERSRIAPILIEDVIFGCTNQAGEDNRNVARMASLLAGLPVDVPGQTVNRLCGSGLQAVVAAHQAIRASEGDLFIAGGVESMTRAPMVMLKATSIYPRGNFEMVDSTIGWRFTNPLLASLHYPYSMGETAENVAAAYGICREDQDLFAAESQRRWAVAQQEKRFEREIIPVSTHDKDGRIVVDRDEHPRPKTTVEALARLRPAFRDEGTVTAGNTSGINDGAAATLVVEQETAQKLGLTPMARIVASAVSGVDPAVMGIGPVPATRKALERANLTAGELDVIELNEAFAAQAVACIRELKLDRDRVNPNGGAIAIGHPLGATGARMVTTLVHELERSKGRYGLATMCIGVGQGIAMVVERSESAG
jgi:3-oxoadipyl-CoA thiolase